MRSEIAVPIAIGEDEFCMVGFCRRVKKGSKHTRRRRQEIAGLYSAQGHAQQTEFREASPTDPLLEVDGIFDYLNKCDVGMGLPPVILTGVPAPIASREASSQGGRPATKGPFGA